MSEPEKDGKKVDMKVPLAVFISAVVAVSGLWFGINRENKAQLYKTVYERELGAIQKDIDEIGILSRKNELSIQRVVNLQEAHMTAEGHPRLEARVRDLERVR